MLTLAPTRVVAVLSHSKGKIFVLTQITHQPQKEKRQHQSITEGYFFVQSIFQIIFTFCLLAINNSGAVLGTTIPIKNTPPT